MMSVASSPLVTDEETVHSLSNDHTATAPIASPSAKGGPASTKTDRLDLPKLTFHNAPLLAVLPQTVDTAEGAGIHNPHGTMRFALAEHGFLGDSLFLQQADGTSVLAATRPLNFPNRLQLTYGQINWLAGDFYGTTNPISSGALEPNGTPSSDQLQRFQAAFDTLAKKSSSKAEAEALIKSARTEIDAVNQALKDHQDPSLAYSKLSSIGQTIEFKGDMINRPHGESYIDLAKINFDHFGADARAAYNAGHTAALEAAARGSNPEDLEKAYTLNAFADHFLEDSFSSGHMRTPRRILHGALGFADACSKYMHDEDCALGLQVVNPRGESWMAFGDGRLSDKADEDNKARCLSALRASVAEVFTAWRTKKLPDMPYAAWQEAPTLESARAETQALAPLFTMDGEVREVIKDRTVWKHQNKPLGELEVAWYTKIAAECHGSGLWKHPMSL